MLLTATCAHQVRPVLYRCTSCGASISSFVCNKLINEFNHLLSETVLFIPANLLCLKKSFWLQVKMLLRFASDFFSAIPQAANEDNQYSNYIKLTRKTMLFLKWCTQ